jgi:hypothetical protein
MPRKRRVAKLVHRQRTWDDVDVGQMLDFWGGWHPPEFEWEGRRGPWRTWEDYLNDWAAVRSDALPEWEAKQAELIAHGRTEVARRAALVEQDGDDHYRQLLADAEEQLAERELEDLPFAEEIYRAVEAGETPESAVWSRRKRLAGTAPDGGDDEDEDSTWEGS